jgi:hypothetical protein
MITIRILLMVPLATALCMPAAAGAQDQIATRIHSDAEAKHERALSMQANGSRLSSIARLHLESAYGRESSDPQAQQCLSTAAHLFYYAGDRRRAGKLLEEAGEFALRRGDIPYAANSFLLAAAVAQERRDDAALRKLVARTEVLASGPALNAVQRLAILSRIRRRGGVVAVSR